LQALTGQVFFVVGKNYRLQDIQLSKNASYFEASGRQHSAAIPREHRLRGEPLSNLLLKCRERVPLDQPSKFTARIRFVQADPDFAPSAKAGGEYRARTGDLLVANQALSQLS
jgi:hypothetical protein